MRSDRGLMAGVGRRPGPESSTWGSPQWRMAPVLPLVTWRASLGADPSAALRAEQRLAPAGPHTFEGGAALVADEHLRFGGKG